MTNSIKKKPRQSIKKQRHHFASQGPYTQSYVQMWNWTMEKAEHQRIVALELWCWRRLLKVPWTTRRLNLSVLNEINREYSLEGLMLKLKLQYFGHVIQRADSLEKNLMLRKIEGRRRRGWQRIGWLDDILNDNSMDVKLSKFQETVKDREICSVALQCCKKLNMIERLNNKGKY